MRKLLFPTDFSEASTKAWIYALRLADRLSATITTIHIYENLPLRASHVRNTLMEIVEESFLEEFETYQDVVRVFHKWADDLGYSHIEQNHILNSGEHVEKTLLRTIQQEKGDMIVMGTTGADGLKQFFGGSLAGEILENADIPVLVIPESEDETDGKIEKIVFGSTFEEEDERALEQLLEIAKALEAEVQMVHVVKDSSRTEKSIGDRWDAIIEQHPEIKLAQLAAASPIQGLIGYMDDHDIDLLATVVHRRGAVKELFSHSLTKRMAYHIKYPILAFQDRNL